MTTNLVGRKVRIDAKFSDKHLRKPDGNWVTAGDGGYGGMIPVVVDLPSAVVGSEATVVAAHERRGHLVLTVEVDQNMLEVTSEMVSFLD